MKKYLTKIGIVIFLSLACFFGTSYGQYLCLNGPYIAGSVDTLSSYSVFKSSNYAYITDDNGLQIIDINNIQEPFIV